jgi:hypothetical protein
MSTAPMPPDPRGGGYGPSASTPDDYRQGGSRSIRPGPSRPQVDAGKLWPGGIATALVAALVALAGVLVCRWLFGIPLLAPKSDGAYGDAHTTGLVLLAAAAALVATGLVHLLLLGTPRPLTFFAWIIGLGTVLAVLVPFSTSAPLTAKLATAVVDLVLGVAIGSLISGVAARSVRLPAGADSAYLGTGADGIS